MPTISYPDSSNDDRCLLHSKPLLLNEISHSNVKSPSFTLPISPPSVDQIEAFIQESTALIIDTFRFSDIHFRYSNDQCLLTNKTPIPISEIPIIFGENDEVEIVKFDVTIPAFSQRKITFVTHTDIENVGLIIS